MIARAPRWAVALPALIVVSPSVADQLAAAEADIPLAAFFACAAAFAYLWHSEGERSSLVLFGIFCAATAATKVGRARIRHRTYRCVCRGGGGAAAAGHGPCLGRHCSARAARRGWCLARVGRSASRTRSRASVGRVTDLSLLVHRLGRAPVAAAYLAARMLDPRAWLVLVPLLVALTVLLAGRRRGEALLVAAIVLVSLATLVVAYWTSQLRASLPSRDVGAPRDHRADSRLGLSRATGVGRRSR